MSNDKTYTCSRCGKKIVAHKSGRIGPEMYCGECTDEYMIDAAIRQLVTVPGRS